MLLGGIDEAGRGPVLGPLVVAGVASAEEEPFADLGLRDSKQLSPRAREKLAAGIRGRADRIEVIQASAEEIDMWRRTMTLNEIEVRLFTMVGRALGADALILDAADVDARRFGLEVASGIRHPCKVFAAHRADEDEPIVSAASIIAKTTRDHEMAKIDREMEQKHGLRCGSGYPSDPVTRNFLDAYVERHGALPPYSRGSWKTGQNVLAAHGLGRAEPRLDVFPTEPSSTPGAVPKA